ncbi:hypothetical protein Cpir12675_000401 [Ceratocystis pirilliformis]|uniref:Major facilitator superfamily (MFS) profile domain-containing protein n=1 Tax=Ceratocystis pirilliformis TaxID=259994 RepID=A0ABR3ZMZ1_9PEZI
MPLGELQFHTIKACFNWNIAYALLIFGLMGSSRGLDEGLIGTTVTLPSFIELFDLESTDLSASQRADRLSNITSMLQLGSILGAVLAFYVTDRLGRLWASRELCLVWMAGISIFLAASRTGNLGMVYAGRFIAGIGVGQTTVVGPTYLAEVAPPAIRGLCVTVFSGFVYLGIMIAYFASWGCSLHISDSSKAQWLVPNSLHLMFGSIILFGSFFAVESPRWLAKVHRTSAARANLSRLRGLPTGHPDIESEMADIQASVAIEENAKEGSSVLTLLRELVTKPANRSRLGLSIAVQFLSQWSGASSITIYAPEYFAMMGVSGSNEKLFATAIFGVVKFVSSMLCAFVLIDFIGRRRSLLAGISLQLLSMFYMALFLVIDKEASVEGSYQSSSQKRAAMGAIVMIYISGFGWALGWNSIQYLINSEIYPIRLRAVGGSIAMTVHFANQYGNSKAVPHMFVGMAEYGTMFFFVAVTAIGFLWVYFFIPELAGLPLEAIDAVFELPWWKIGRKGREAVTQAIDEKDRAVCKDIYEVEVIEDEKGPNPHKIEVLEANVNSKA